MVLEAFCNGSLLEVSLYTSDLGDSGCYFLSYSHSLHAWDICFPPTPGFVYCPENIDFLVFALERLLFFNLYLRRIAVCWWFACCWCYNWQLLLKIFTKCYRKLWLTRLNIIVLLLITQGCTFKHLVRVTSVLSCYLPVFKYRMSGTGVFWFYPTSSCHYWWTFIGIYLFWPTLLYPKWGYTVLRRFHKIFYFSSSQFHCTLCFSQILIMFLLLC